MPFNYIPTKLVSAPEKAKLDKKIFLHYIIKNLQRCESTTDLENFCHYAAEQFEESLKEIYHRDYSKSYAVMIQELKSIESFEAKKSHVFSEFPNYFYVREGFAKRINMGENSLLAAKENQ